MLTRTAQVSYVGTLARLEVVAAAVWQVCPQPLRPQHRVLARMYTCEYTIDASRHEAHGTRRGIDIPAVQIDISQPCVHRPA